MVNALEVKNCGMEHDPEEKRETKEKERKEDQRRATISIRPSVQEDIPVIRVIHFGAPSSRGKLQTLGECAFKHTAQAGGEAKKRKHSVAVAKTLDSTQEEKKVTSQGDLLHDVWGIPIQPSVHKVGKEDVQTFRLSRVAKHFVPHVENYTTRLRK